jgi:translation initiation factor 2 subunit 1
MPVRRTEWPERGELVLATVRKVLDYGAYVSLEEYGEKEGLLHRSEISTSWVRNIRNHVREGQKIVLKVLRTDPRKKHIDLSRRRVSKRDRIDKIYTFKQERKAETFLRFAAKTAKKSFSKIVEEAASPMEEAYGSVYIALEEASRQGSEVLTKLGIPAETAQILYELAQERIHPALVEIGGFLQLTTSKPDGVGNIQQALQAASKTSSKAASIQIYTIAAPKYRLKVKAEDYKQAETALNNASEIAIKTIEAAGGEGSFHREK